MADDPQPEPDDYGVDDEFRSFDWVFGDRNDE